MAKRSPIAGYNHNVRYRGLIFHVQTEDSGLQSPHLFTHMFYGGVIISTRKLVYDAGSAEDAIKGLMQSQHKIVLRDLKKGVFDDKIDQYLAGNEELLPRGSAGGGDDGERSTGAQPPAADLPRESEPALQVRMSEPEITLTRPETDHDISPEMLEPVEEQPAPVFARAATPPPIPARTTPATTPPTPTRTKTAERKSGPSSIRTSLPPPPPSMGELDPPTFNEQKDSIAEAFAAVSAIAPRDSGPDIQIRLELENSDGVAAPRTRSGRDTDIEMPHSDGVPGAPMAGAASGRASSSGSVPPPSGSTERKTGDRINAVGAAALPPARPIARPPSRQALSPPAVMSRPLTNDDARSRGDSDAIEVYAPPPGSADERPGQYAQHKRVSQRIPVDIMKGDRSGPVPIPSGLARPGRSSQSPGSGGIPQRITREPSPKNQTQPIHALSRSGTPSPSPELAARPEQRPRTPTPARVSSSSSSSPATNRAPSSSGGVVMTRPAVIVGAPARTTQPKVRKAREEEGRGFGQGLISEKSLDEVILAYLSEDADDK